MSKHAGARPRLELELHDTIIERVELGGASVVLHLSRAVIHESRGTSFRKGRLVLDGVVVVSADVRMRLRAAQISYGALVDAADEEQQMLVVGDVYPTLYMQIATTAGDDVRIDCSSAVALV